MAVVMTLVITILGAVSLGTDIAMIFYRRMRLQKGADASALSGATYFLTYNKRGSTESGHQLRLHFSQRYYRMSLAIFRSSL